MLGMELLKRWLPVFVWMLVIFTFSSFSKLPGPEDTGLNFLFKKLAHITVYGILFFLLQRGFNWEKVLPKHYLWSFIITILYAASDEWHQSFVPGRHPQIYDIGFDSIGALISYALTKKSTAHIDDQKLSR